MNFGLGQNKPFKSFSQLLQKLLQTCKMESLSMQSSSRPQQFSRRTGGEVGINRVEDMSYMHG